MLCSAAAMRVNVIHAYTLSHIYMEYTQHHTQYHTHTYERTHNIIHMRVHTISYIYTWEYIAYESLHNIIHTHMRVHTISHIHIWESTYSFELRIYIFKRENIWCRLLQLIDIHLLSMLLMFDHNTWHIINDDSALYHDILWMMIVLYHDIYILIMSLTWSHHMTHVYY